MDRPDDVLVIHGSPAKSVGIAVLGVVMTLLGVWFIRTGDPQSLRVLVGGWGSAILFPICAAIALLNALNPPALTLTHEGFSVRRLFSPRRFVPWRHVGRFFLWGTGSARLVAFNYQDGCEPDDLMTRLNSLLGAPGNLGAHWSIEPEALLGEIALRHAAATRN